MGLEEKMLHLKVKKISGEDIRGKLLRRGALKEGYHILTDDEFLYFPLQKEVKISGAEIIDRAGEEIEERNKSPAELLGDKLRREELSLLPQSFDVIGDILIVELDEKLRGKEKDIGEAFLKAHHNVRVVLKKLSDREGEFRTRDFEILAGERRTETIHKEYDCEFKLDVRRVYFSPREARERQRIARQVRKGEKVLVMFAGISPFAVQIAKLQDCRITCLEKNPEAVRYAEENIRLNKVMDRVKNVCGDVREISPRLGKFDRVLMPLPKGAYKFLEVAISGVKKGGILHFYHWAREEELFSEAEKLIEKATKKVGRKMKILEERKVLPYAPRTWKVVLDVKIEKHI